jgi:hypothetical protein
MTVRPHTRVDTDWKIATRILVPDDRPSSAVAFQSRPMIRVMLMMNKPTIVSTSSVVLTAGNISM